METSTTSGTLAGVTETRALTATEIADLVGLPTVDGLAVLSLCSGYGGLDEAVEAATGGRVTAHVEYDEDPSRILAHRYPGIPNHGDVKTMPWEDWADAYRALGMRLAVCGGYPCQPFSSAGKRKGVEDERHLWPAIADGLRRIRPDLVVFENVRNHLNLGFDVVLGDLDSLGYDVTWTLLRASDVGAPHGRARLFIVGRLRQHAAPDRVPTCRVSPEGWTEHSDGLFGSIPWKGKIPVTGRLVNGAIYPLHLPDLPDGEIDTRKAQPGDDDDPDVLPTPRVSATRTSRGALTADGQWSAPSLEQTLEMMRGELPREYQSWDEVKGRSGAMRPDGPLIPTPLSSDAGPRGGTTGFGLRDWSRGIARGREDAPEALLKTPTAQLAVNGGSQHPDKRKEGGHGPTLADELEHLLPTPTSRLGHAGPDPRAGRTEGVDLTTALLRQEGDERIPALPTPTARDGKGGTAPEGRQRGGRDRTDGDGGLPDAVRDLFPTPVASDGERTTAAHGRGNPTLHGAAGGLLLPTPVSADTWGAQGPEDPDEWEQWKAERASRGIPTGQGMLSTAVRTLPTDRLLPTPIAALGDARNSNVWDRDDPRATGQLNTALGKLLPTPEASDGSGGRVSSEAGGTRPSGAKRSVTLATAVHHEIPTADGELFPTPRATRGGSGTETMYALGAERSDADRPQGEVLLPTPTCQDAANLGGPSQHERKTVPLNALATLLPTPKASDGEKGGPNQRGSSGDLMLPSAVVHMAAAPVPDRNLPTPATTDATGSRNSTAVRSDGAAPFSPGDTLTDAMWKVSGVDGPASVGPDYAPISSWGPYAAAVARWEAVVGPAPSPTEAGKGGKQRLSPPFPEWMMGLPRGWVTEVPGLSRNAQLKAIGNGVVPQQGFVAIARQLAHLPW